MRAMRVPEANEMKLTTVLHALSDPVRLKIVLCLARTGEKNCSSFEVEHLSKSTLSHHVKILREGGIIQPRIEGKQHYYSIRRDNLDLCFPGLLDSILATDEQYI
ncbi:hypothetical protein BBD42_23210 [Paenibacillus sp. BIHB 4019]|uniref:HTH arsR-type domain-containing protein n=2 Tax=Paenibacillus sp. BIHB 4019 TaxID=1870819 RepID=A0A1B2DTA0_9BACL|nr:hypothetical protein BBD42_23210 [Paenibacillus sp. BIHB 4019]